MKKMHRNIVYGILLIGICLSIGGSLYLFKTGINQRVNLIAPISPLSALSSSVPYGSSVWISDTTNQCDQWAWSFSGSNSAVGITVMAMDSGNYSRLLAAESYSYILIAAGQNYVASGTFEPIYAANWYILFLNNSTTHQTTTLTYSATINWAYYCTTPTTSTVVNSYNSFANANQISVGTSYGTIDTSSNDYFEVYLYSGAATTVSLRWTGSAGITLTVYNPTEQYIGSDTITQAGFSPVVDFTPTSSGYYYIEVAMVSGSATAYSLTITS